MFSIKGYIKKIVREVLVECLKEEKDVVFEKKKVTKAVLLQKYNGNEFMQLLHIHRRGFKSLHMHFTYFSEFGTEEQEVARSIQEILSFDPYKINDDITEVKGISFFIKSFDRKERNSCCSLLPYDKNINLDNSVLILNKAKEDIQKFPDLILV